MNKSEAYQIVLEDLKKCNLFCGTYDARHSNIHYMYGISTVMESIAYKVNDEIGDKFVEAFDNNMTASENKAKQAIKEEKKKNKEKKEKKKKKK